MVEKKNSIFVISTNKTVKIILEINYENESYSILPINGQNNFRFINDSKKNYLKWIDIINCINEAIYFANKELNIKE